MGMGKKTLIPITQGQTGTGPSNAVLLNYRIGDSIIDSSSGFVKVGNFDSVNIDILATGSSVALNYSIESLDYWNNVVSLHTGDFTGAGNTVLEIYPNARDCIRTNITSYTSGVLFATALLSNFNYR